jgi:phosphopantothenoylcysteine decarboxylase/phosphopantothenate--cysteine ligase
LSPTLTNSRPLSPEPRSLQELKGRKILLGICGGIAAYKAVELTRLLMKAGAQVQVIMTAAAAKFISPLTFETVTARHVFIEMFPPHGEFSPWHTELATWPDLAVIAPATANHMARLTAGIADDLLSTIMLTLERPRLICPSMNHRMWANPATQENVAVLRRRGYRFVLPEEGAMARPGEEEGMGRLADLETIFREIAHILSSPQDLHDVRVLVTAGRTEESWDPVRVLTNRASGRMGFALAEEARERGADVVLIHGPTDVIPPVGVRVRRVTTAADMAAAVKQEYPPSRIVLMAAAVADYTFAETAEHKLKKGGPPPQIQLVGTEDILRSLADQKGDRVVVGFALETENLLENALRKLREKHLDIVVANNPLSPGSGFAEETNQVLIIHRSGRVIELPLQSKREVAREILNAVIEIYRHPEPEPEEIADDEEPAETEPASGDHRRGHRRRGRRHHKPVAVSPAAPEVASPPQPKPPAGPTEQTAELPLTDLPAGSPAKPGKPRRGGRRSARARARRAAEVTPHDSVASAQSKPETSGPPASANPRPSGRRRGKGSANK